MIIRVNQIPAQGSKVVDSSNVNGGNGAAVNGGGKADYLAQQSDPNSAAINANLRPTVAGDSPMGSGSTGLASFKVTFDNSGQPARTFYLGRANAVALSGVAGLIPPSSMSNDVTASLDSFAFAPLSVGALILQAQTDPAQIQEEILVYRGSDLNKSSKGIGAVPNGTVVNPIFNNPLAARMVFTDPTDQPALSWNQFMTFDLLADEVLTVTVVPSVAFNRQD